MSEDKEVPIHELSQVAARKEVPDTTLAERHPDWPPISLMFYFSPHGTPDDIAGMKSYLDSADIYFYECAAGDYKTELFQMVADQNPDDLPDDYIDSIIEEYSQRWKKPIRGTSDEMVVRTLFGSKKIIGHIDLRPGDNTSVKDYENRYGISDDFEETLENLKNMAKNFATFNGARENIMVGRFEDEMKRIMDNHPELKEKPEIKILHTMGAYHKSLYHRFNKAGVKTSNAFSSMPYVYSFEDQVYKTTELGRDPDRDLLARAFLEAILLQNINEILQENVNSNDLLDGYIRNVALRFTFNDIKDIHQEVAENRLSVDALNKILIEKGINSLPRNNNELELRVVEAKNSRKMDS